MGLGRVELPTSPLSGVRSSQLSYRPGAESPKPKVFEDRLNVRSSYAGSDYRWNGTGKRGSKRSSLLHSIRTVQSGLMHLPAEADESTIVSLRKEVIQPQVLLRLPCYDFTPIMIYTLDGYSSYELAHRLLVQTTFVM